MHIASILQSDHLQPHCMHSGLMRQLACDAGARCTATLLHEMNKRGKSARFGIVSMCIGSGMGAAAVFERGGEVDHVRNARKVATQDYLSRDAAV